MPGVGVGGARNRERTQEAISPPPKEEQKQIDEEAEDFHYGACESTQAKPPCLFSFAFAPPKHCTRADLLLQWAGRAYPQEAAIAAQSSGQVP